MAAARISSFWARKMLLLRSSVPRCAQRVEHVESRWKCGAWCIPHVVVRGGGRATDPIRRHVPVAMARRVGSRTVLCLRKSIFDAEFFRGTYFCTLLPGSQVRLAWKYLAAFLLFLHPLRICSLLEVSLVHTHTTSACGGGSTAPGRVVRAC